MENAIKTAIAASPVPAKPVTKADNKPNVAKVAIGAETPKSLANSKSEDEKIEDIKDLDGLRKFALKQGKAHANGANALPSLGIEMVSLAKKGIITLEEKTMDVKVSGTAKKTDHTGAAYADYLEGFGKVKGVFSDGSWRANCSKLRQFTELGAAAKIDGVAVISQARTAFIEFNGGLSAREKKSESKTFYPFLLDVCRAQLDALDPAKNGDGKQLGKAAIADLVKKPKAIAKDVEAKLKAIAKTLELLTTSKKEGVEAQDGHAKTKAALKLLNERINELVTLKEAAAKGLKPAK